MNSNRKFLPAGTELIESNGTRYKIRREIASGGSSLIYEACLEGSLRNFVIKECYPDTKKFSFERQDGVIRPTKPTDIEACEYLRLVKKNMEHENEIGQLLANVTGRAVAPWGKLNVAKIIIDEQSFDAADSLFIVMERVTDDEKKRGIFLTDLLSECAEKPSIDSPLRNGGNPSPFVATKILEELLKSLRDIHAAGYIHADINESNFYLMGHDFKRGDIGVGQLLDFSSARKLLDDGKTAPVDELFSTPGYWSPEIFFHGTEILRLTPATDIYSAGCLMLYLFHGMKYRAVRANKLAASKRIPSISIPETVRHGYRREAGKLFVKILTKALQFCPEDRYQSGAEMLEDIRRLKTLTAPPKFMLASNLTRCPYFVEGSRDEELAELQRETERGKIPLVIYGVGGIGKTELAYEFARRQIKDGVPAYSVTFKGNIRDTVLSLNFSGYESDAPGSELDYRRRIDLLKENYQGCLLIVDNFDDEEKSLSTLMNEVAYKDLVYGTGLKILLTTRSRPDEATKELTALSEENALKLFKSISPVSAEDEALVRELIREVACHPMTVELLAKTREDSWQTISCRELLQRLRYRNMDDNNLPVVGIKKNLSEREAKIYGHIRTLFDVCNLGEYRRALCHVTLLPLDGFDAAKFIGNEDVAQQTQLKDLERRSWIRRHKENNRLTIHSLIRTVFKNELRPDDEDCSDFLRRLWSLADNSYPPDFEFFGQSAELFERATNDLTDKRGDFAFYAGFCFLALGKISSASFYEDKAVKIREVALSDDPRELARTYNDAGVAALSSENFGVYSDVGLAAFEGFSALGGDDFDKGMRYLNNACKLLETLPTVEDKQNLANVYASMAMSLGNREDVEKSLPLAQKAVAIFTEHPPQNLYEKAHAHQTLAQSFTLKKRYAEALEQSKIDVAIKQQVISEDHPELAKAYRELAESFALAGDNEHAEEYALKSLHMLEKFFPDAHPEILFTYRVLCAIYQESGRVEEHERCDKKASDIFFKVQRNVWQSKLDYARRLIEAAQVPVDENILRNNPDVAKLLTESKAADLVKYNREAAEACRQLFDFDSAEKYIVASMQKISERTDLLEVSSTLFTAARILFRRREFSRALPIILRAVTIQEKTTPQNFDKFSEELILLGDVYTALKRDDDALNAFERAIDVQKQNPNPEHSVMELATLSACKSLMRLKRFDEGARRLQALLDKQLHIFHETHPRIEAVKNLLRQATERKSPD